MCQSSCQKVRETLARHYSTRSKWLLKEIQGSHNIPRLMNITHAKQETSDTAVIGLDAEKAFDRVKHEYLFEALHRFGIGSYILK